MAEQRSAFRFRLPWPRATTPKKSRSPKQSPPRLSYSEPYQKFEFLNPPKFEGFPPPQRNAPHEPPQSPPWSYRSPPQRKTVFSELMSPEELLRLKSTKKEYSPLESPPSPEEKLLLKRTEKLFARPESPPSPEEKLLLKLTEKIYSPLPPRGKNSISSTDVKSTKKAYSAPDVEQYFLKLTEKLYSPTESPQSSGPPSPLALSPSRDASYPRKRLPELPNGNNSQQQFLKAVFKPLSPSRKASEQQRQPTLSQSPQRYPSEYNTTKVKIKDIGQEFTSTTAKTEEPQKQEINTAKTEESTSTVNQEQVKMVLTEEQIRAIFKKFEEKGEKLLKKKDLKKAFYHFGFFFPHYAPINVSDANKDGYIKLKDLEVLVDYALKQGYTVK